MITPRYPLLPHLQATTCRTRAGKLLQTTFHNARWSFQYKPKFILSTQDYHLIGHNLWLLNQVENLRTSHNTHTHTGNTLQSKPQLKECSCSSVISSHNSRDVILSHNSRDTVPSHNSRNTLASRSLGITQSLIDHAYKKHTNILPCIIAWRCLSAAKQKPNVDRLAEALFRQAPRALKASNLAGIA